MKKLMLAVCFLGLSVRGDVWQDCTGWFQAVDLNGDGKFQTGEWLDLRHAARADEVQFQARPRGGAESITITNVAVDVASLGREKTLEDEPCLYLPAPDGDCVNGPYKVVDDVVELSEAARATNDQYTVLVRFKRAAESHRYGSPEAWTNNYVDRIIDLGLDFDAKRGLLVSIYGNGSRPQIMTTFGKAADTATGLYLDWDADRPPRMAHPDRDCWHELAIVVDGTTVTYGLLQPGIYGLMKEVDDGIDYNGKTEQWKTIELTANKNLWGNNITNVVPTRNYWLGNNGPTSIKSPFRGWYHMTACWNRALSRAEIKEAFGRPHPSLLRLGGAGCGAEMFAGSPTAETAVDARTVAGQRRMPSSLAAGDKVAISFSVDAYTAGLPQLLRVLSAADSCEGALAAALDGEPVGSLDLKPGMLSLLYVPGQNLTVGTHTLTVRRTDVGADALRLDRVELGGSRRFGLQDGGWREDTSKETFSEADYFAFDGNLRNLRYAVTKTADLRIHFDLDAEVAANCPLTYRAKMAGSPVTAYNERRELQINGTCAYADLSTNAEFTVRLPRASLKAGENTFDWHYVEPKAETWIWWTFDYHEFVVGKPRAGLCVIVR